MTHTAETAADADDKEEAEHDGPDEEARRKR